jgi:hypothetical protein
MKQIIISTIILILSNSFLFGMFSFGAWNINPACWQEGTRVLFAFLSAFLFAFWVAYIIYYLLNRESSKVNSKANQINPEYRFKV